MLAMKIGMMSAWNLDAGPSLHAELIGREWVRMGHNLSVYSFLPSDFHGTTFVGRDEPYVSRCFRTRKGLDPRPILKSHLDVFVVQDLGMLPKDELGKIFHHIKNKAKTVNIIHDAELSSEASFYQFDWDAMVCFDERYRSFLREVFPEEKIRIIPYPCRAVSKGDKKEARRKLGLSLDERILLIFGQHVKDDLELLPTISTLGKRYHILLLVVSIHSPSQIAALNVEVEIRSEAPEIAVLYDYLHAADALILHRKAERKAVVSSTAYQCLGSGCPIIAYDSPFFDTFKDEILKYRTSDEFEANLVEAFEEGEKFKTTVRAAEEYAQKNSAEKIAAKYIELFEELQN